jgi:putative protease
VKPEWLAELSKISHRGYTTGFFLGKPVDVDLEFDSRYRRSHEFVGVVEEAHPDGTVTVEARNRIVAGATVEVIGRRMRSTLHRLDDFTDTEGNSITEAHPNQRIRIRLPVAAERYDLIRRER